MDQDTHATVSMDQIQGLQQQIVELCGGIEDGIMVLGDVERH